MQLTSCELNQQRQLIRTLAAQAVSISPEQEQQLREQYKMLTLSYGLGKAVYASYSNEELLSVLRQTAAQIGHSPAQHEVFFLYRIYLKARFRTWPKALYAAGMRMFPPSTLGVIDWEKVQKEESEICAALELVSNMQDRLGYPPQKRKVNNAKMLCTRFRTWENVIAAAEEFRKWKVARESYL